MGINQFVYLIVLFFLKLSSVDWLTFYRLFKTIGFMVKDLL